MIIHRKPIPATAINHDLAAALAEQFDVRPRECYRNSLVAQARSQEPLCYVEGWLILEDGEFPIEHGWLQQGKTVIDPSILDEAASNYYAVFCYEATDVMRLVRQRGAMPFWNRTKAKREIMRAAHKSLPVNQEVALFWTRMGEIYTGITSVILTKEGNRRNQLERAYF